MGADFYYRDCIFDDCTFIGKNMYFFTKKNGFLEVWDSTSQKIEILDTKGESFYIERLISFNGKLYGTEVSGKRLIIYDTYRKEINTVSIECNREKYGNINDVFEYNGRIFIIPNIADKILIYDDERHILSEIKIQNKEHCRGVKVDDSYYLFAKSKIITIDLKKSTVENYKNANIPDGMRSCVYINKSFYFILNGGKVYEYRQEDDNLNLLLNIDGNEYSHLIVLKDNYMLLPNNRRGKITYVKKQTMKQEVIKNLPSDFCYSEDCEMSVFWGYCEVDNKFVFAKRMANYLVIIDKKSGDIQFERVPEISVELQKKLVKKNRFLREKVVYEDEMLKLNDMIELL